ncbi:exonuclease subunit SbcD [Staphylococcus sp. 17KM0847]|uniref:exonuclease subunit SbcD n=1 Tax=Staphylococcus sp. 17KM0847 TaxID=2583989 RepID=UPI0015DCDF07|nr:exonuclease subunit SbcD [Staphylococcus sp. 17KM0847]QLK86231.1 exonuclease SbcCD subunit D [Staphylococcus sp. 17KM0847]
MKIIHTADWHLGKRLNGHSFLEDQSWILNQFVEEMKQENPDIIVIAGDIYDTAYPSKQAVGLMENIIQQLNLNMRIPIIIINGNHDSRERLGYGASWFHSTQLFVRTTLDAFFTPLEFENIAFYTLPFFTVSEARNFLEDDFETYEDAVKIFVNRIADKMDHHKQNVLVGHFTLNGTPKSDSERDITVGTIEGVSPQFLEMFDCVLLGHIHQPFALNYERIIYSGSLLQYSFSETKQAKGYRVVEITKDGGFNQYFKPLRPKHELEVVEGDYEDIINGDFEHKSNTSYFHFKLSNIGHVTEPMQKLKQLYPNTLALTPEKFMIQDIPKQNMHIKTSQPIEIIQSFYQAHTDMPLTHIQKAYIETLLNEQGEEE